MEPPRKLFKASICNFLVWKICKKEYMEMTKKIYLETLKSVLGDSILHYYRSVNANCTADSCFMWNSVHAKNSTTKVSQDVLSYFSVSGYV